MLVVKRAHQRHSVFMVGEERGNGGLGDLRQMGNEEGGGLEVPRRGELGRDGMGSLELGLTLRMLTGSIWHQLKTNGRWSKI